MGLQRFNFGGSESKQKEIVSTDCFTDFDIGAIKRADGDVRLVLGGVAAGPMRVNPSIEEDVASGALDEESVMALAERAMYDATPLEHNAYKVQQAASLLRDAMFALSRA